MYIQSIPSKAARSFTAGIVSQPMQWTYQPIATIYNIHIQQTSSIRNALIIVPMQMSHTAHGKSHCTNLPLYTMHLTHANVSLYTYVASRLASLQIVILPNGANHTNKLQPIRKRQTCIHTYKNCISYIQVDGVKGEEEIFNLGSKKSFMWASFDLFRQLASDSLSWWRARLAFNATVKTRLNDLWYVFPFQIGTCWENHIIGLIMYCVRMYC